MMADKQRFRGRYLRQVKTTVVTACFASQGLWQSWARRKFQDGIVGKAQGI
jgi:hypothetical protein